MSTLLTPMPLLGTTLLSSLLVPPYRSSPATMCPPAGTSLVATASAAMPDVKARARAPPSSAAHCRPAQHSTQQHQSDSQLRGCCNRDREQQHSWAGSAVNNSVPGEPPDSQTAAATLQWRHHPTPHPTPPHDTTLHPPAPPALCVWGCRCECSQTARSPSHPAAQTSLSGTGAAHWHQRDPLQTRVQGAAAWSPA